MSYSNVPLSSNVSDECTERALQGEGNWVDDDTCIMSVEDAEVRGSIRDDGSIEWNY